MGPLLGEYGFLTHFHGLNESEARSRVWEMQRLFNIREFQFYDAMEGYSDPPLLTQQVWHCRFLHRRIERRVIEWYTSEIRRIGGRSWLYVQAAATNPGDLDMREGFEFVGQHVVNHKPLLDAVAPNAAWATRIVPAWGDFAKALGFSGIHWDTLGRFSSGMVASTDFSGFLRTALPEMEKRGLGQSANFVDGFGWDPSLLWDQVIAFPYVEAWTLPSQEDFFYTQVSPPPTGGGVFVCYPGKSVSHVGEMQNQGEKGVYPFDLMLKRWKKAQRRGAAYLAIGDGIRHVQTQYFPDTVSISNADVAKIRWRIFSYRTTSSTTSTTTSTIAPPSQTSTTTTSATATTTATEANSWSQWRVGGIMGGVPWAHSASTAPPTSTLTSTSTSTLTTTSRSTSTTSMTTTRPETSSTTASTSTRSAFVSIRTPQPYDCKDDMNGYWTKRWSAGKRAWCCLYHQVGCTTPTVTTTTSAEVDSSGGCDILCTVRGLPASCGARMKWVADHLYPGNPLGCHHGRTTVIRECPTCFACPLSALGCPVQRTAATAAAAALATTTEPPAATASARTAATQASHIAHHGAHRKVADNRTDKDVFDVDDSLREASNSRKWQTGDWHSAVRQKASEAHAAVASHVLPLGLLLGVASMAAAVVLKAGQHLAVRASLGQAPAKWYFVRWARRRPGHDPRSQSRSLIEAQQHPEEEDTGSDTDLEMEGL